MTTVAVYAAQMKGQGVGDDDIIQQIRQQTGKHKPGPNDEVPGTPPSQPLSQGNGQPEGLGMAAPTPQGLTGQGGDTPMPSHWNTGGQAANGPAYSGGMPELTSMQMGDGSGRPPQNTGCPVPQGASVGSQGLMGMPPEQPQMPEQSLFGQMGDGLKSMGQGMSGYMGKLFNDPNRMALLQGGLSMMDPNSYYDKQGFGSVFTGLNKGLGAAQGGMQGVLDRRKSRAETASQKAAALKAERGGNPTEVDIANGMVQLYKDGIPYGQPYKKATGGSDPTYVKLIQERDQHRPGSKRYNEIQNMINKMSYVPDQFPTTNTDVFQATPNFSGQGPKYKIESAIKKGNKPLTEGEVIKAKGDTSKAGRAVQNIGQLFGQLSVTGDIVGGELFGDNVISNWNTFVDNMGISSWGSESRRKIDSFQNALKRDLTREYLEDGRDSKFNKLLVLDSMGYDGKSSVDKKMRAMPDAVGLTYENYAESAEKAGQTVLPLREYLEANNIPEALIKMVESKAAKGSGLGETTPSGFKRGSNNNLF